MAASFDDTVLVSLSVVEGVFIYSVTSYKQSSPGLLVSFLQKKVPIYHIAVAGSLLNFLSLVAAAFVPNILWMTLTMGIIGGTGCGMIVVTLSIYTVLYFDKYRGAASGFKYTGMTLAPLAFPLALSALIQEFNVFGALLVLSAVELNTLPVAMLMNKPRPGSSYCSIVCLREVSISSPQDYGTKVDHDSLRAEQRSTPVVAFKSHPLRPSQENNRSNLVVCTASVLSTGEQADVTKPTTELYAVVGEAAGNIDGKKNKPIPGERPQSAIPLDRAESTTKTAHVIIQDLQERQETITDCKILSIAPSKLNANYIEEYNVGADILSSNNVQSELGHLFRNPMLYVLVATFTMSEYIMSTFEMTLLDYSLDKGCSRKEAEPVITYVAAAELLGRLTLPLLWDCAQLPRNTLVALCLTVTAASLAVLPHLTAFGHVVAIGVVTGCSCGCAVALKPVLLSDHLGVQMLPLCWGIAGLAMIPFYFGGSFLIGLFRDKMGSYDNLYRTMSALCIVFAAMLFTSAFFVKRTR
ncbi:hypothetical protein HPB50_018200 [Hyalomma asiaticum]|uniref:Uncharacterized protein n=1 Tax=Hyalomma asiaticum TaxID=266040 RepID=A0ACB7TLT8_HYAAI|nr:hypothetical protein HPB50_018200 [Hyalomma asiaticum]